MVLVIIKAKIKGSKRNKYLFKYSDKTTKYQMVGGYKLPDETPEGSAVRHLYKEFENFNLTKKDYKLEK